MNLTTTTVARSLAAYLAPHFPDITFYEDPNQQKTITPCMFLQQRGSKIDRETGGYWMRTIRFDLVYIVDYNLPNMQELYVKALEMLDLALKVFPYTDGESTHLHLIRTYQREGTIDLDALHYKFELRERVSIPENAVKMREIEEYSEEVNQWE
jgi:hypothetical protein|nr:MAG TPA: tail completion protein [Caudoviricetes sp.]